MRVAKMYVRLATEQDIPCIMPIFSYARSYMADSGNANQWIDGYPSGQKILADIGRGDFYVIEEKECGIVGCFCFYIGEDPSYAVIEKGEWLNDKPYGVVHRLASNGKVKGIAACCFDWCFSHCRNIRIDTHRDNKTLQHILSKFGFLYCGIIHVENGTERLAFQKEIK